jgi:hypothetical protein
MGNSRPAERRRCGRRTPLMNVITRVMTTSLVAYVVVVLAQRTWALLNLDVSQLIRRF